MRFLIAMVGAVLAACAHAEQAPGPASAPALAAYDPYEPVSLERAALERLSANDRDAACILVERAARISPYDRRIASNIQELEFKAVAGSVAPSAAAPPAVRVQAPQARATVAIPPEPPALWPRR